jgi:hypothetical protein
METNGAVIVARRGTLMIHAFNWRNSARCGCAHLNTSLLRLGTVRMNFKKWTRKSNARVLDATA